MTGELRSLTGIRGVAALLVTAYHFSITRSGQLESQLSLKGAYLAVDAFFILSGFVLALSYAALFSQTITLQDYRAFMLKRFLRIYPAYFFIMIIYLMRLYVNISGDGAISQYTAIDFISNALMLHTWAIDAKPIIGPSWSVCVEILCYFVFPLIVAVVSSFRYAPALAILFSFAGIVLVSTSGQGEGGNLDVVSGETLYPVLRALCGFSIGIGAYYVWKKSRLFSDNRFGTYLFLTICGLATATATGAPDLVLYVLIGAAVILTATPSTVSQVLFGNSTAHYLGKISYSLYLLHSLLIAIFVKLVPIFTPILGYKVAYFATFTLYLIASICVASVSYSLFEVRARNIIERVIRRPAAASA